MAKCLIAIDFGNKSFPSAVRIPLNNIHLSVSFQQPLGQESSADKFGIRSIFNTTTGV
jgi:hypothetical protein